MRGYSDVINHAFAFAAKHHDQQVRKGTKLPYLTQPANIAVILTRYGRDEATVVAGILYDVIEDCVLDGHTAEMLQHRIVGKFGGDVLNTVLAVSYRRHDDDDVELSAGERKADFLRRLALAREPGHWVVAAHRLHHAGSIIADLNRTADPPSVWSRFEGGRAATIGWCRSVYERLLQLGFDGAIMQELHAVIQDLENRV